MEFLRKPAFRYTLFFLAGLLSGLLIFSLVNNRNAPLPIDAGKLAGTATDNPADWKTAGTQQLQGTDFKGTCATRYNGELVEIYLTLSSGNAVKASFEFDATDFSIEAVVNQEAAGNATVTSGPGSVEMEGSGLNRIAIRLGNKDDRPHNIVLQISQNGTQLYQNAVTVNEQ